MSERAARTSDRPWMWQFTGSCSLPLRDILITEFGTEAADRIYYKAGELAGRQFCKQLINKNNDFNGFVRETQELLSKLKIGIMRIEKADLEKIEFYVDGS